jgi:leucyl-tRNA synthetase
MYLAFMGPYGTPTNYPWDLGGIAGIRRFLERVYDLDKHVISPFNQNSYSYLDGQSIKSDVVNTTETTRLLHQTIAKVTSDIENLKFNTAISALMVFVNGAEKSGLAKGDYLLFLRILAPFAPHLSEELWERAGNTESIHLESWPVADQTLVMSDTATIAVQINGKARETITISREASEEEAVTTAKADPAVAKRLEGVTITKVIYIPGRALNLIVS